MCFLLSTLSLGSLGLSDASGQKCQRPELVKEARWFQELPYKKDGWKHKFSDTILERWEQWSEGWAGVGAQIWAMVGEKWVKEEERKEREKWELGDMNKKEELEKESRL